MYKNTLRSLSIHDSSFVRALGANLPVLVLLLFFSAGCSPVPHLYLSSQKSASPSSDGGTGETEPSVISGPIKHAHNDYEHSRPLQDALEQGFESVEADVWWLNNEIGVSHQGPEIKGTLEALYLAPLNARVASLGFVQSKDRPFYLWVDLKEGKKELQEALKAALAKYDIFTLFDDQGIHTQRAVTVILTGNAAAKQALVNVAAEQLLPFTRDGSPVVASDPPANGRWFAYALQWPLVWNDCAPLPDSSKKLVSDRVELAHQKGRLVRFWAAPDTDCSWQLQREIGADFIGADDLSGLRFVMEKSGS